MKPTPDKEPAQIRPFADFLRDQDKGRTHEELSTGLHDLVEAVKLTGKKGSLTFTVTVAPIDKGHTEQLRVTDAVVIKAPRGDRASSIFFTDQAGNLTRRDPNQLEFSTMRVVDDAAPEADEAHA